MPIEEDSPFGILLSKNMAEKRLQKYLKRLKVQEALKMGSSNLLV